MELRNWPIGQASGTWVRTIPRATTEQYRRPAISLGVATFLFLLAMLPPVFYEFDGQSMLAVAESMVARSDVTVPSYLGTPGPDGHSYSGHYILLSVIAVPFVALGSLLAGISKLPPHYISIVLVLVLSAMLTAGTVALVWLLCSELGGSRLGACIAALSYLFGTIALVYARQFFAEPLLAFLTVLALYLAVRPSVAEHRTPLTLMAVSGLAILAKPSGIILAPAISLYLWLRGDGVRRALTPLLGAALGVGVWGLYNYARFGDPTMSGQPTAFALSNVPVGLLGLLVSPGRGIVWYAPATVLVLVALRQVTRGRALEIALVLGVAGAYLGLYSTWDYWYGGDAWGPRFLLPALPGLFAIIGLLEERWRPAIIALTLVGFIISAPTLVSFYARYSLEAAQAGIPAEAVIWSPVHAPIIRIWSSAYAQVQDAVHSDVGELLLLTGRGRENAVQEDAANKPTLRIVTLWWWMLPLVGIPRWVGAGVAAAMVAVAGWLTLAACRQESRVPQGASVAAASEVLNRPTLSG